MNQCREKVLGEMGPSLLLMEELP